MGGRSIAAHATIALAPGIVIAASLATWAPVKAGESLTAADITAAVSDHTYQGSMTKAASAFSEYYQPDGIIKGKGYSGKWRVVDGAMCFQYGDKPETCWNVEINGPSMVMFKDGKVDGNGMLIKGNAHNF